MAIWSLSSLDCEVDESLLLALTDRIVAMSADTTFNSIDICNILVCAAGGLHTSSVRFSSVTDLVC